MPLNLEKKHRYFHAFCTYPDLKFDVQERDEKVILVLRAHPITQIPWLVNSILLFVLLYLSNSFFNNFLSTLQIVFFNLSISFFILSYAWINFISWFFNVGIITNKRIVDVDYQPITYKEVTGTRLGKVEDVTDKTTGFFASIFNYGDLFIQTAGAEINIEFLSIPAPATAVRIINKLIGRT